LEQSETTRIVNYSLIKDRLNGLVKSVDALKCS